MVRVSPIEAGLAIHKHVAADIISGTFDASMVIGDFPASRIVGGYFDESVIGELPASKITSGEFGVDRIPVLTTAKIPNLPASILTSGVIALARIPTTLTGKDADSVDGCDAGLSDGDVAKLPVATEGKALVRGATEWEAGDPVPKAEDETESFIWDTSVYTTVEQDISALFTTPLTGTKRRKHSVFLDLTGPAGDAAAWTTCTVKVKVKIDATNYRTIDKKVIAKTGVAAAEEPGVPIDIPAVAQDVQITMQFDVALGADQTIYYHQVKEVLE